MAGRSNQYEIKKAMLAYAGLALLYAILVFALPASDKALSVYHVTSFQYRVILFAVVLPSLLVWFAAFWSYAKLQHYARSVQDTPEGANFAKLAKGCTWLAWSFPVTAIISLCLHAMGSGASGWHSAAVIAGNYAKLVPTLAAFSLIGTAARTFMYDAKLKISLNATRSIILTFVLTGVLYCLVIFRDVNLHGLGNSHNPYFLPLWLLVVTFIVPYLYTWFVGLLAAYEIVIYSRKVHGVLYRRSLRLLVGGLVAVLLSAMMIQYITGQDSRTGYLLLDYKLLLLTVFRIIGGIGFLLLAFGADRLKKIEDV